MNIRSAKAEGYFFTCDSHGSVKPLAGYRYLDS